MKKPEILSPAGNMECLYAAITAGCDAVYLGGYIYGARAFSNNFSEEEIIKAVSYAHEYGVKVYVTVNTLIYENEVETFMNYVDFLYNANVDALIVQDIGMMDLIRQTYPDFDIHASTQMHIHNIEGVKLVEKMGLTRAVLARETSIDTIKEIKSNTNIELEIFVHGALCISYSGQCLMSSLIGGRSGNRGTCAGSCRQKYDILDENKNKVNDLEYNLSTKDLNSLENIGRLIDIGVDSLKIEGRMKSPSYVYLVTKLYRTAVDSYCNSGKVEIDEDTLKNLKKTFNRKFTKGFLFNTDNNDIINPFRPNHLGIEIGKVIKVNGNKVTIRLKEELNLNDGIRFIEDDKGLIVTKMFKNGKTVTEAFPNDVIEIYVDDAIKNNSIIVKTLDYKLNKEINNIIKENDRKALINGIFEAHKNNKMLLTITDSFNEIKLESENIVEEAINIPSTYDNVKKQLVKTGNTPFKFNDIEINMDDNLFISIKELNELRRKALDQLLEKRKQIKRIYLKTNYHRDVVDYSNEHIKSIYVKTLEQYDKVKDNDYDRIYVDLDAFDRVRDDKVFLRLPRVMNNFNEYNNHILVGELGSINKYKDIDTDFSLNIVNSYAVALLNSLGVKRITLSYEMDDKQINDLIKAYKNRYKSNPNLSIIVYAKEEIMISKFNVLKFYNLKDNGYLKDRFNNLYRINIKNDLMYIYNYKARNIKDIKKYYDMGISEVRYNVIDEKDLKEI